MCNSHNQVQVTNETPLYEHDCDLCTYLGRFEGPNYGKVDLYVHLGGFMPTVIARWGSDGPNYASGFDFSFGGIEELTEARKRTEAAGLLEYDVYKALDYARKGTEAFEELKKALPFTKEYQAILAFRNGDVARSEGLVQHLVQMAFKKIASYKEDVQQPEAINYVGSRIAKILEVMEGLSFEGWGVATEMLDFITKPAFEALIKKAVQ